MGSRDLTILEKLKNGNPSGYKELFDLYYEPLTSYALKYCDSFSVAEDIVQELFIKIWDKKLYLEFEAPIGPYLFMAVRNNALLAVKRNSRYYFEEIEDEVNTLMEEEQSSREVSEQEKEKLYKEIEALPEKGREVFKAIVLQNMKYKEVAEQMGISINTVKTHYSRALKQLRQLLAIMVLLLLL
ncbi:RNA polymerase sigma-70 factor [Sinomicrobium pectinilyticum]|uniref:RNA polymerase sigma-70 factor n=1 Tax=Sinomicrobium pectinilyticum TaxID=1084421 RepID=A0A3N0EC45_SINP1|nr:RNA polymerase sigma-70 factor [Sinomicrobium pectinilyticum]RNL85396.1 RNA polymerase sigma-70 factor [Sinomicrobium pectinilyticum]